MLYSSSTHLAWSPKCWFLRTAAPAPCHGGWMLHCARKPLNGSGHAGWASTSSPASPFGPAPCLWAPWSLGCANSTLWRAGGSSHHTLRTTVGAPFLASPSCPPRQRWGALPLVCAATEQPGPVWCRGGCREQALHKQLSVHNAEGRWAKGLQRSMLQQQGCAPGWHASIWGLLRQVACPPA